MPHSWGSRAATKLTRLVLARDTDPTLGWAPCYWCGRPATTADHWPISRIDGGPDHPDNLVAACRPCNSARGARTGNQRRRDRAGPSRPW